MNLTVQFNSEETYSNKYDLRVFLILGLYALKIYVRFSLRWTHQLSEFYPDFHRFQKDSFVNSFLTTCMYLFL